MDIRIPDCFVGNYLRQSDELVPHPKKNQARLRSRSTLLRTKLDSDSAERHSNSMSYSLDHVSFAMSSLPYAYADMQVPNHPGAAREEDMENFFMAASYPSTSAQIYNNNALLPNMSMSGSYLPYGDEWAQTYQPTADYYEYTDSIPYAQHSPVPAPTTTTAPPIHYNPATYTPPTPTPDPEPSHSHPKDLTHYGLPNADGTWRCAYPGCASQAVFRRGCDLRKHFNRHRKHLFCRHEGCPQAVAGGFSSKKDRARHEAKHNPVVPCEWPGCGRVFSRVDNMKDHVRRIHKRGGVC